jgi:hypothetical protein
MQRESISPLAYKALCFFVVLRLQLCITWKLQVEPESWNREIWFDRREIYLISLGIWRVLRVMYNTRNCWGSGLCSSSVILNTINMTLRKLGMFSSSGDGRKTPNHLSPWTWLRLALFKEFWTCFRLTLSKEFWKSLGLTVFEGPNRVGIFLPSPEDRNRWSFRNVVFSSI